MSGAEGQGVGRPGGLVASSTPLVESFDGLLLDLDGVVYVGSDAVPGAVDALSRAQALALSLGYVTNNAARSPATVAEHLESLGLRCQPDQVITSALLAADWLAERFARGSAILVIGGIGLREAVVSRGLCPVTEWEHHPVAVVQGFGPDVGWRQLAQASYALEAGIPWVATNLDLTVPTPEGPALGNGALVRALSVASGRTPDVVTGKPDRRVFAAAARQWGLRQPLVVGDRLDTDMAGATAAGLPSLLVLTGVSRVAELCAAQPGERPSLIGRDLLALFNCHAAPVASQGSAELGGWMARTEGDELRLEGGGDPVDGLRCAAVIAWGAADLGSPVDFAEVADRLELLLVPSG